MRRLLLLPLLLAPASAANVDILPEMYKDGVFRSSVTLPASQTPKDGKAVQLTPDQYGGQWFLTLRGPQKEVTNAHLSYAGNGQGFAQNAPTVAKLTARLTGTLAGACLNIAADRLGALKTWVEEKVKQATGRDVNAEVRFGPVQVQVLTRKSDGNGSSMEGLQEVDVLLSRSGPPGKGAWGNTCKK